MKDWNGLLPYEADEGGEIINDIKNALGNAILSHDIFPSAFYYLKRLHSVIDLKFKIEPKDRAQLILLLYQLLGLKNLDIGVQTLVASASSALLKKGADLNDQNLVLDWKVLYRLIQDIYLAPNRLRVIIGDKKHCSQLFHLLNYARNYFPKGSTQEILDEFRPLLYLLGNDFFSGQGYLTRFLPTNTEDVGLWFEEFFQIAEWTQHIPNAEYLWLYLFSRVAEDRVAKVDWEPHMPKIFSMILDTFDLPLGSIKMPPAYVREVPQKAAIFKTSLAERVKIMGKLVVHLITPRSSALNHLEELITLTEHFFNPANHGSWVFFLTKFLEKLTQEFSLRLIDERSPTCKIPPEDRLTEEIRTRFVTILSKVTLVSIFGKDYVGIMSSQAALRHLAAVEPKSALPSLIEGVYSSLSNLTETHRTNSSLGALASVTQTLTDRERYPEGATHLLALMHLILPGIDVNDPAKSFASLQFLVNILVNIVVHDATENMSDEELSEQDLELRGSTAQFEEWVLAFFDRVFLMLENLPEEQGKASLLNIESNLARVISSAVEVLMSQTTEPIYSMAFKKIYDFISRNPTIHSVRGAGHICAGLSISNPEKTLAAFVPLCASKIMDEISSGNLLASSPVNIELKWFQKILARSISFGGSHLLGYKKQLFQVLGKTLVIPQKSAYSMGAKLMKSLLKSITAVYPTEYRSFSPDVWSSQEFRSQHYKHWGGSPKMDELKVSWHIPSEQEIDLAIEILEQFVRPEVEILRQMASGQIKNPSPDAISRSLTVIRYALRGGASLCHPDRSRGAESAPQEIPLKRWILNGGYSLKPGSPRFEKVIALQDEMIEATKAILGLLSSSLDDQTKAVKIVIKIFRIFLTQYGANTEKTSQRLRGYQHYKNFLKNPIDDDHNGPRYLLVKRIQIQHMKRLNFNSFNITATALHESLLEELFTLSVFNRYSAIRKKAQAALQSSLTRFPLSKGSLLRKLFPIIENPSTETSQLKGALHTLRTRPFMNQCLQRWDYQAGIMLCLTKAQRDEKSSVQQLVRLVFHDFTSSFVFLPLEKPVFTEESMRVARETVTQPLSEQRISEIISYQDSKWRKNVSTYHDLVLGLKEFLTSQHHWAFELMAGNFLELVLRKEMPEESVVWFYHALNSELPQSRRLAVSAILRILYFSKLLSRDQGQEAYTVQVEVPHSVTPEFEDKVLGSCTAPITPETLLVDNLSVGWYAWPRSFKAYIPGKGTPAPIGFSLSVLKDILQTEDFWKGFLPFLAQELSGTTLAPFNSYNAQFWKSIFKHFEDSFLDLLLPHLKKLCESSQDRGNQKAAAELLSGLVRGSKNWSLEKQQRLRSIIQPLLASTLETITPDTLADWDSFLKFSTHKLDPRRSAWIIDMVLGASLSEDQKYSFSETRKLTFLQSLHNVFGWRISEKAPQVLDAMFTHLSHPYKNTRSQIGTMIGTIFMIAWRPNHPMKPYVGEFVQRTIQRLVSEREKLVDVPPEEFLNNPPAYVKTSKTVLCWIYDGLHKVTVLPFRPYLSEVLPHLFDMIETNDQDLQVMSKSVVDSITHENFEGEMNRTFLKNLAEPCKHPHWHVRLRAAPILALFALHNFFYLTASDLDFVEKMLVSMLSDQQLEVREVASQVLSGTVRSCRRESIPVLLETFKKALRASAPSKQKSIEPAEKAAEGEKLLKRHSAVLGLSGIILGFPFDVPEWMPNALELIASHLNSPNPIHTTVKKTVADFRRTHQDTWHIDKEAFTEAQLEILSEMLIAPSYYA